MSVKQARKLGFFAAISMLIGSVVGIGIFFKSHGILRANDWNGTGTLIAWLIGGLLSLSAAVAFSEMGSIKTKNTHGLAAYSEIVTKSKKFGYFSRFNFSFFYFGIILIAFTFFSSEISISSIVAFTNHSVSDVPLWAHALVALFNGAFFISINFISIRASGIIASVTTILKWIPLVLAFLLGIIMATTNVRSASPIDVANGAPAFGYNAFTNGRSFTFAGMFAALPAVLFSYDAFLNVLSLNKKIKGGEKTLPVIVIVGMISITVLYTLIALAAILHGSGMITGLPFGKDAALKGGLGIFDQLFASETLTLNIGKVVIIFLWASTMGSMNAMSAAFVANVEQTVASNTIFGAKTLKKKWGKNTAEILIMTAILLFWFLIIFIPAIILKTDSYIDGITNFPTLFFFAIYGIVIFHYTIRRSEFNNKKINNKIFKLFAWIAIVGIIIVVGYQLIYGFFINAILHPTNPTHWGLYVGDATTITDGQLPFVFGGVALARGFSLGEAAIMLFVFLLLFLTIPLINAKLVSKFEHENVIKNTQE